MTIKVDVTVGEFKVIASGVIHTTKSELSITITYPYSDREDNIKFVFRFRFDTEGKRFEIHPSEQNDMAYVDLFNHSGLGGGLFNPVDAATMDDGKNISFTYTVSTYGKDNEAKEFTYVFYVS